MIELLIGLAIGLAIGVTFMFSRWQDREHELIVLVMELQHRAWTAEHPPKDRP